MPEGMRDRIAEAASENGRSMNAEIVARLQDSFARVESVRQEALEEFRTMMRIAMVEETHRWNSTEWGAQFNLQTEIGAIDEWIARQPDPKPSRGDALKALVRLGMK